MLRLQWLFLFYLYQANKYRRMDDQELSELAMQLRQPHADKGLRVADMMNKNNVGMIRHSIDLLQLEDHLQVLELGPGNAGHLEYLLYKRRSLRYHALDISELMVKEAERLNRKRVEAGEASFSIYDGMNIPFEDDSFDRIFTVNTIYFWEKPAYLLNEMYRVLKKEGVLNLTFAERKFMEKLPFVRFGFNLYDSHESIALLKGAGLTIHGIEKQTETVASKLGEQVDRDFITITATKKEE